VNTSVRNWASPCFLGQFGSLSFLLLNTHQLSEANFLNYLEIHRETSCEQVDHVAIVSLTEFKVMMKGSKAQSRRILQRGPARILNFGVKI
jgi:hypothetical protein